MGERLRDFKELSVWQKSHQLAVLIYGATANFPKTEQFSLTNQLRRAAVSVPSNIAEGFERRSNKEFSQFLGIARGSIAEVQTQLLLARDIGYLKPDVHDELIGVAIEVHKMVNGLLKTLAN